jgi:hypothetical protein
LRYSPGKESVMADGEGNRGQFRAGNPGYGLRREKEDAISAVGDKVAALYDDMKHVRRFPPSCDKSPGQKDCRRWKKLDLKGFMARFAKLEKAQPTKPSGGENSEPEPRDEGTQRAQSLIQQILDRATRFAGVGTRVADAWEKLPDTDRLAIQERVDAVLGPDDEGWGPST